MDTSLNPPHFYGSEHHEQWCTNKDKMFDQISDRLMRVLAVLKLDKKDISLVGTGMSGALSVPIISHKTDIPFALIRRDEETTMISDNPRRIIGEARDKVIFIDDLIHKGRTIRRVNKILDEFSIELVGAVMARECWEEREGKKENNNTDRWISYSLQDDKWVPVIVRELEND